MNKCLVKKWFQIAEALIVGAMFWACSDDKGMAGGTTEDAGIIAELNVAGVAQKGPFVKGSVVSVQGINCRTFEPTGEYYETTIKSNGGDYEVDDVNLSSVCAVFEVSGYYLSEITGAVSSEKLTLRAVTNLKNRDRVNINVLTHLEYERVMYLVTVNKMSLADAKKQAEKEIFAVFNIKGDFAEAEDLNIFEAGDGNAALLAISVMMQAEFEDTTLEEHFERFNEFFAKNGVWYDSYAKLEIAKWAQDAAADGKLDSIRKNIESWGFASEIPSFETSVKNFGETALVEYPSVNYSGFYIDWSIPKEAYLNPEIKYDSIVDSRDGQVYKTVTIGTQVWMAQNLNYADSVKTPSLLKRSWCFAYRSENCDVAGRLYTWAAIIDSVKLATDVEKPQKCGFGEHCVFTEKVRGICPEGWHLPDTTEWKTLISFAGGDDIAGERLESHIGMYEDSGTDDFGFSAFPAGEKYRDRFFFEDSRDVHFWTASEESKDDRSSCSADFSYASVWFSCGFKDNGLSVRCVRDEPAAVSLSSSSNNAVLNSSSSDEAYVSPRDINWSIPKEDHLNPNIKYDSIVDKRDGQVYKTVKIGTQIWMAQNLNYADSVNTPSLLKRNWCYGDKPENCEFGGRLYTWAAAVDSIKLANDAENPQFCGYLTNCSFPAKYQGICPEGWHLPDTTEWRTLIFQVSNDASVAGYKLASRVGWFEEANGTDDYGFSAYPVGDKYRDYDFSEFAPDNRTAFFWSITENTRDKQLGYSFRIFYGGTGYTGDFKDSGFSIRCLKN
ncbi:fibrobacter succinogenes major paralogous domain-containing protein [Fibrobacter succinogenes]|uniref:fibrobacter succinogenes major paralogous domain-containing protein n=1 Tax=Fibrobacter succinogenes TaxID=833 RepID=UPI0026F06BC5|nr:fibrobacter succinogenes major paralogous domain-containing protein [Fibrobacter succinogenes]